MKTTEERKKKFFTALNLQNFPHIEEIIEILNAYKPQE